MRYVSVIYSNIGLFFCFYTLFLFHRMSEDRSEEVVVVAAPADIEPKQDAIVAPAEVAEPETESKPESEYVFDCFNSITVKMAKDVSYFVSNT